MGGEGAPMTGKKITQCRAPVGLNTGLIAGYLLNNNNGFIHYWMFDTKGVNNGYLNFG
jgi:hypothetical protein